MLESMYWKKKQLLAKKRSFRPKKKNPFWGVETQITAHFAVNSYSLSKHLSFDMLESIGEKKTVYGNKRPFWPKRGLFWGSKSKKPQIFR